ncbi:MAG: class II aldolase/adducin family protein, partial [Verrucomicrobiales bacterium]|nr:class II aldolase/adducin family protein [Verrucomicrobiales bacterium]
MKSRWNEEEAGEFLGDPLALRVYTSRLLGADPELVLHGGGNTSVKVRERTFFGDEEELIYVKGSGWDLGTIEAAGFAPVRMAALLKMAELSELGDAEMVKQQRAAMTDPAAPTPSIEAILHAVIPFKYVDHTHANAVVAVTNHADGEARVEEVYGKRVLVVPYVMPGFILAKTIYEMTRGADWGAIDGMILMNHGIFTFADDAQESYEAMVRLVDEAEVWLKAKAGGDGLVEGQAEEDLLGLAALRRGVAGKRGCAVVARYDGSAEAVGYSGLEGIEDVATRGPLTPDHTIRTKRIPGVVGEDIDGDLGRFADTYAAYFARHSSGEQTMLTADPRWVVWKGKGVVAFGANEKEAGIVGDIAEHTYKTVQLAEATGGWEALGEKEIFDIEYWELEQAKLKTAGAKRAFEGKVAIVTGSAAGIGFACAETLA